MNRSRRLLRFLFASMLTGWFLLGLYLLLRVFLVDVDAMLPNGPEDILFRKFLISNFFASVPMYFVAILRVHLVKKYGPLILFHVFGWTFLVVFVVAFFLM